MHKVAGLWVGCGLCVCRDTVVYEGGREVREG